MSIIPLERFDVFTPLGIRFWDPVLDRPVDDALIVTAQPASGRSRPVVATRTASSIYTFHNLPGFQHVAFRELPDSQHTSPSDTRAYVIDVTDQRQRYLPVRFTVSLPLPYAGIYLSDSDSESPASAPHGVYLFSDPRRQVDRRAYAEVRGELLDESTREPAGHALVAVEVGGRTWFGIADGKGRFVVVFPWPARLPDVGGSPDPFINRSLFDQLWEMRVEVRYDPQPQWLQETAPPEYASIVNQRAGAIWPARPDDGAGPLPSLTVELAFGQQAILRTQQTSQLLVSSAGTSP